MSSDVFSVDELEGQSGSSDEKYEGAIGCFSVLRCIKRMPIQSPKKSSLNE